MKSDDFLLAVAVVAVVVSVVGVSMTYNSVSDFQNILTGYFIEEGYINVSLTSNAAINISSAAGDSGNKTINWGGGTVTELTNHATLSTAGAGSVVNGSWGVKGGGFIIDNIGNENVTLAVSADGDADAFLGGSTGGGPLFQYNMTDSMANSCNSWVGGFENTWKNFTTSPITVCNNFSKVDTLDQLRLDVKLVIPDDADPGDKSATVTLTYSAV